MVSLRWLAVVLAALLCAAEAWALLPGRARPMVVAFTDAPEPPDRDAKTPEGLEPAFASHMTWDDVARGVWGLASEPGRLDATQRAALVPLLEEGGELRRRLGELRATRRAARLALVEHHARMASVAGPARVKAMRR